MYGGWTEYAVLWTNYLGFIWEIKNVSTTYIFWPWSQSRLSKSSFWVLRIFFIKLLNNEDKKYQNSKLISCLEEQVQKKIGATLLDLP